MDQTIEQLQVQLTQLNADIQTAKSQGNFAKSTELEEQLAKVQYQIEELQKEEANNAAYTFTVGGETINLRDYVTDESSYQLLKIALSQRDVEVEAKQQADIDNLTAMKDQQIAQWKNQFEAAQTAAEQKYNELETQYNDVTGKLAAATAEIESLTAENASLRAKQDKPAQPTNTDSEALREAKRKADAAKPRIYNKRQGDATGTYFLANLLETDEEITIKWLDLGRYVEASADEIARFREEAAAKAAEQAAAMDAVPESSEEDVPANDQSVAVPAIGGSFQDVPEAAGVQGNGTGEEAVSNVGVGMASEGLAVSRVEFEELKSQVSKLDAELRARVAKLEDGQQGAAA